MVQLLVQQVSKLVQAHREMPQSQEAVVRRPVKWAQSGRLLPLLWSDSSLRRDDHTGATQSPLTCALSIISIKLMKVLVLWVEIFVSKLPQVGVVLF